MRNLGVLAASLLMAGTFNPALGRPTRSTHPRYYSQPPRRDPLAADRVAWNNAVDKKKAAKRAAKLAKKGGV